MLRGQIYYIYGRGNLGERDDKPARPAIIVTSDALLDKIDKVQVVYLTSHPQTNMVTHVNIDATGTPSTALCELIAWVDKDRIGDFCGVLSPEEAERLDTALMVALGLDVYAEYEYTEEDENEEGEGESVGLMSDATKALLDITRTVERVSGERDAYKAMVEQMLDKVKA